MQTKRKKKYNPNKKSQIQTLKLKNVIEAIADFAEASEPMWTCGLLESDVKDFIQEGKSRGLSTDAAKYAIHEVSVDAFLKSVKSFPEMQLKWTVAACQEISPELFKEICKSKGYGKEINIYIFEYDFSIFVSVIEHLTK